ncbi:MAG: PLDc N-terminal domain-containing protein [Bryobacterales bacterium]|nr:PLDc N-terminal domain-containing protein [Bryobacterales bacterium]
MFNTQPAPIATATASPSVRTLLRFFLALLTAATAWGQRSDGGDLAACAGCGLLGIIPVIIILALIALNIYLLVWVARDAKARGLDNSVLWMILVLITGVVGLIIYLLSRPKGELIACASCGNKRLQVSAKCPHCGNA